MHDTVNAEDLLRDELAQRHETGYDVGDIADRVSEMATIHDETAAALYAEVVAAPRVANWPYEEPSGLDEVRSTLPSEPGHGGSLPEDELRDRILGGWLGRCAGCNLGKPIENGAHWTVERIRSYLERAGAYPLRDYFPVLDPMPEEYELRDNWPYTTRGNIDGSARDDDTDYTILGLHILEAHGFDFTSADVGAEWLTHLPILQTYTAERAAYRNLVAGLAPPESATRRNPYREWIGAQIRADAFGYVSPGDPRRAAELAYRDASVSHVANGIYGEMWAAALVASAFTASSAKGALERSLDHIPKQSRLAEALRLMIDQHAAGVSWDGTRALITERFGHYSWVHTINNAAVVAAALLFGDDDFSATVGLAVQSGLDTDCNGATAGSVMGVLLGAQALPKHWVDPLRDSVRSGLSGFDHSRISDLADRTFRLARSSR